MTPAGARRRLFLWLPAAVTFFVNGAMYGVWATQVPLAKARLGVDDAAFGQLLFFMGLGAVSAMAASGRLIPVFGAARLISVSLAVFVASLLALSCLPGVQPFAVALLLFGASGGMMDVAMNAFAAETEARIGRPVMSSIHGMWSVGGLASAGLGSLLLSLLPGFGQAVTICIILALLFLLIRPRIVSPGPASGRTGTRVYRVGGFVWIVGVLALLCFSAEGSVRDWSSLYLGTALAAPLSKAAWGYAAYSACMAGGRLGGDWIRHRMNETWIVFGCGLVAAAGFGLVAFASGIAIAIAGFALVGIGLANIVPVFVSAAGRSPSGAPAVAIVVTLGYAGYLVSPPVLGAIAGETSLAIMFLIVAGVALIVAAAWVLVSADKRLSIPS